ncbi:uncharacterized protein MYCFIDRAFT_173849 [Pseudocercospora fijiensis CIRAD86]|uniref:Uncharacterized protein n=1 Tax=Pseudocercospora fijiensis (strain CIRAD86) TaxID=383855 RepID=M3B6H6_PSEFD|nr:uncharacterized protein MYCFIDRAFT_173849 [Pseudocercospora fijiensis CIRAD86]EME84967.1 hypothetical protein MYCFIDRAFT_173849 [Pseudocercospora fijiensis CIRAD86]
MPDRSPLEKCLMFLGTFRSHQFRAVGEQGVNYQLVDLGPSLLPTSISDPEPTNNRSVFHSWSRIRSWNGHIAADIEHLQHIFRKSTTYMRASSRGHVGFVGQILQSRSVSDDVCVVLRYHSCTRQDAARLTSSGLSFETFNLLIVRTFLRSSSSHRLSHCREESHSCYANWLDAGQIPGRSRNDWFLGLSLANVTMSRRKAICWLTRAVPAYLQASTVGLCICRHISTAIKRDGGRGLFKGITAVRHLAKSRHRRCSDRVRSQAHAITFEMALCKSDPPCLIMVHCDRLQTMGDSSFPSPRPIILCRWAIGKGACHHQSHQSPHTPLGERQLTSVRIVASYADMIGHKHNKNFEQSLLTIGLMKEGRICRTGIREATISPSAPFPEQCYAIYMYLGGVSEAEGSGTEMTVTPGAAGRGRERHIQGCIVGSFRPPSVHNDEALGCCGQLASQQLANFTTRKPPDVIAATFLQDNFDASAFCLVARRSCARAVVEHAGHSSGTAYSRRGEARRGMDGEARAPLQPSLRTATDNGSSEEEALSIAGELGCGACWRWHVSTCPHGAPKVDGHHHVHAAWQGRAGQGRAGQGTFNLAGIEHAMRFCCCFCRPAGRVTLAFDADADAASDVTAAWSALFSYLSFPAARPSRSVLCTHLREPTASLARALQPPGNVLVSECYCPSKLDLATTRTTPDETRRNRPPGALPLCIRTRSPHRTRYPTALALSTADEQRARQDHYSRRTVEKLTAEQEQAKNVGTCDEAAHYY